MRALLFLFALGLTSALGQGTKADYERAYGLGKRFGGKVFHAEVRPKWFGGRHFW